MRCFAVRRQASTARPHAAACRSPYQQILLNHSRLRTRYDAILSGLIDGPLSEATLHAFIDAVEPVLLPALVEDPFVSEDPAATFEALKAWVAERIPNVLSQIAANGPPSPR